MRLRLRERVLTLERGRPLLMGILNVGADSVSDERRYLELDRQIQRAHELRDAGAGLIDVGAESGRTDRGPLDVEAEISMVRPLVEQLSRDGLAVSVDTWKAPVAAALVEAGAVMINDVSGMRDERLVEVARDAGAALVVMHTDVAPKVEGFPGYDDPAASVLASLQERVSRAMEMGVDPEQIVVDPGPDFSKTPAESVAVLRRLRDLHRLGRPVLLATSRKYFVGVVTHRRPVDRLAGSLAALLAGVDAGAHIARVHDVAESADAIRVWAALRGHADVPIHDPADEALKWVDPARSPGGASRQSRAG